MNQVTDWKYEHPRSEGSYLACYGDVESFCNMRFIDVWKLDGILVATESGEHKHRPLDYYGDGWKWAKLSFNNNEEQRDDD